MVRPVPPPPWFYAIRAICCTGAAALLAAACARAIEDAVWLAAPAPVTARDSALLAPGPHQPAGAPGTRAGTGATAPVLPSARAPDRSDSRAGASEPDSLPGPHPVIGVGATRRGPPPGVLYGLSVVRCGSGRPVWIVGTGGVNAAPPSRIVYGSPPRGYANREGPGQLTPGCYHVFTSGGGSTHLLVREDGTVVEDSTRRR